MLRVTGTGSSPVDTSDDPFHIETIAGFAIEATGNIDILACTLVDSYNACGGPYGGSNQGNQGNIQAGDDIDVHRNAVVNGTQSPNTPSGAVPEPVPDGLTSAGDLVISNSLTLAAGDYYYDTITIEGGQGALLGGEG